MAVTQTVFKTLDQLEAGLDHIVGSPSDQGTVEMIVIRPEEDIRDTPDRVEVSPEGGLHGDRWVAHGSPYPESQVTLINARLLDLVAGGRHRWKLAGDNLVVDLDLSPFNLGAGQQLQVGSAVLEVTDKPHTGCHKFSGRYGADALRFVNRGRGRELRLRGIYARVVEAGVISVGDRLNKI